MTTSYMRCPASGGKVIQYLNRCFATIPERIVASETARNCVGAAASTASNECQKCSELPAQMSEGLKRNASATSTKLASVATSIIGASAKELLIGQLLSTAASTEIYKREGQ